MRRWSSLLLLTQIVIAAAGRVTGPSVLSGQTAARARPRGGHARAAELYSSLDDAFLRWPLPAGAERYGAIDGKRMHRDVVEQALISRRYRDQRPSEVLGPDHRHVVRRRERGVAGGEVQGGGPVGREDSAARSRAAVDAADLGCGRDRRRQDRATRQRAAVLRRERTACRRHRRRSRVRRARERGGFRREGRDAAKRCSSSTRPD